MAIHNITQKVKDDAAKFVAKTKNWGNPHNAGVHYVRPYSKTAKARQKNQAAYQS